MIKEWTHKEDTLLKRVYPKSSLEELYERFDMYTKADVDKRIADLHLEEKLTKSRNRVAKWTNDEANTLIKLYPTTSSIEDLCTHLPYTVNQINYKARQLDLKRVKKKQSNRPKPKTLDWTFEELELLYNNYSTHTAVQLVDMLDNKTTNDIYTQAQRLGIYGTSKDTKKVSDWTLEEVLRLRKNSKLVDVDALTKLFPKKSKEVIVEKARDINVKLRHSALDVDWHPADITELKSLFLTKTFEEVCTHFSLYTPKSIRTKLTQLGLTKDDQSLNTWSDFEIETLKEFYMTSSVDELLKLFPHYTWMVIYHKALELGMYRD